MNNPSLKRILFVLTIAIALMYIGSFSIPKSWTLRALDHRAIQHLIGFTGFAMLLQLNFWTTASTRSYLVFVLTISLILAVVWAAYLSPTSLPPLSENIRAMMEVAVILATPYFLGLAVFCSLFLYTSRLVAAVTGVVFCLVVSWSWELVIEPFIKAYGAPAHGFVQWEQVIVDLLAIAVAYATLWGVGLHKLLRVRTN